MPGVSYYQLLGVEPDASPETIKAAWRDATDKFEPGQGSGQFALFNEAADVLLDPERRAAYDAEIGAGASPDVVEPPPASAPAPSPEKKPRTERKTKGAKDAAAPVAAASTTTATKERDRADASPDDAADGDGTGSRVPTLLAGVLAVVLVAALAVGGVFWFKDRDQSQVEDAGDQASAAAERALPVVLSYDYRHLKADRDQAVRFLTPRYKREYATTFDKLITSDGDQPGPAAQAKAVVKASVEDVGVVSAQSGRVRVIVFLNQTTTKGDANPKLSLNRLVVSMVKSGNSWLVENITSY